MAYFQDQQKQQKYQYDVNSGKTGGEGTVYELNSGNEVMKIFHPGKEKAKEDKLKLMISMYHGLSSKQQQDIIQICAWPTNFVYDDHGKFIGYTMPKASGIELGSFLTPITRRKNGYRESYILRASIALNISKCYHIIHSYFPDVCLGDVSKANILVEKNGMTHLIDLDSIQINIKGHLFLSEVHTPGYTSPERIKNPKSVITQASDDFSLAILIFELLMNYEQSATHPFVFLKANGNGSGMTPDDAILKGICLYVKGNSQYKLPDQVKPLQDVLNSELIDCFIDTFDQGINNPIMRTPAKKWMNEIYSFIGQIENNHCSKNNDHVSLFIDCPYCHGRCQNGIKKSQTGKSKNKSVMNHRNKNQTINTPVQPQLIHRPQINTIPITSNPYARLNRIQAIQNNVQIPTSVQGNNNSKDDNTLVIGFIIFVLFLVVAVCTMML